MGSNAPSPPIVSLFPNKKTQASFEVAIANKEVKEVLKGVSPLQIS